MTVKVLDGKTEVLEASNFDEACIGLKFTLPKDVLIIPHTNRKEIHLREPDKNGDYLKVKVLKVV